MNDEEIIKAVIELAVIALEVFYIVWTIKNLGKLKERQETTWNLLQDLKRDNADQFKEIQELKREIKELKETKSPE